MGDARSTGWLTGGTSDDQWGQSVYSELAIEAGMMLRLVFHSLPSSLFWDGLRKRKL
jgi:hypothetical protein